MKKKTVALVIVAALLVVGAAYIAVRLKNHGTDIIGVTTLTAKNTVIMNAKAGNEFVSGAGQLTVGEGERIHVEYNLKAGEIDVAFRANEGDFASYEDITPDNENLEEVLNSLPAPEDMAGEGSFGQDGVSGKGSLDFDAAPGAYAVRIAIHDAIGKAVVTAVKAG